MDTVALIADRDTAISALKERVSDGVDVIQDYLCGAPGGGIDHRGDRDRFGPQVRLFAVVRISGMAGSTITVRAFELLTSADDRRGAGSADPTVIAGAIPALLARLASGVAQTV